MLTPPPKQSLPRRGRRWRRSNETNNLPLRTQPMHPSRSLRLLREEYVEGVGAESSRNENPP